MRLPIGFADRVRSQADIVQIISDYVTLKKRGVNYLALCPFHQEKTPSFTVHPGKQIFKCFGCGLGGDVLKFVMEIEGYSFPEAVRSVAERYGIPIPRMEEPTRDLIEEEQKQRQWRERLLRINQLAQAFFQAQLKTAEGRKALDYLNQRGLHREVIEQTGVGYAPPQWEALSSYLRRQRIPDDQVVQSGLIVPRSDGRGYYDRFRDRVIFPITDVQGRVVAFGGRALEETGESTGPKYLNSPETAVYIKGRHLFGLSYAKEPLRRAESAILVEGYFDFLIPFQSGIRNVVASLGTALTEAQVSLIRRFTNKIIVNFDPDPAGRAAAMRSLQMLVQYGLDVRVLVLPQGADPDLFIRQAGADAYLQLLPQSDGYLDFVIGQATEELDLHDPRARAQALKEILPYIVTIPDRIERIASGDGIAARLMLDRELVQKEIGRQVRSLRDAGRAETTPPIVLASSQPSLTEAERLLLEILLSRTDVANRVSGRLSAKLDALRGQAAYPVFEAIATRLENEEPLEYAVLAEQFENEPVLLDILERCFLAEFDQDLDALCQQAEGCLESLERTSLERDLRQLQQEIEDAQRTGDSSLCSQLLLRKLEVSNLLASMRSRHLVEVDAERITSS